MKHEWALKPTNERKKLNKEFNLWWKENGYKYIPESDEEADWCNVVRYWAWKGFEAGRVK